MAKLRIFALAGLMACALVAWMYSVATRDPIVRRTAVALPDWPTGGRPIHVALLSDIHVAGPEMSPERLREIVDQVNYLKPDLILLAGDFVSDKRTATKHYSAADAIAPLAALRAPFGVVAVLGNHDHWRSETEIAAALRAANIRILDNQALSVGPLRLGGVDDAFTGRADVARTVAAMRSAPGARVMLSHSPDIVPEVPPDVSLILAGHTHCGQIRLPLVGAISYMSEYGERFACGPVKHRGKRVITSAGLGTSLLPLRLGAPPDLWFLTLGPRAAKASEELGDVGA